MIFKEKREVWNFSPETALIGDPDGLSPPDAV